MLAGLPRVRLPRNLCSAWYVIIKGRKEFDRFESLKNRRHIMKLHHAPSQQEDRSDTMTQIDPVCGMTVDSAKEGPEYEYKGKLYHFCSGSCRERFMEEPEKYTR